MTTVTLPIRDLGPQERRVLEHFLGYRFEEDQEVIKIGRAHV